MGAAILWRKDGFVFSGFGEPPFPTARINEDGSETPLTLEEIEAWQEDYINARPELKKEMEEKKKREEEGMEAVRIWMEKVREDEAEHQRYLDSMGITEEEYQEREMKRLCFKKNVKYACRIGLALFTIFMGLITYIALTPMDEYPCEAGQEDMSPYWFILITAVSFITFCIVWNNTRKWPKDEIKKYKTKAEKEQEEFDLYFDIDKYLLEIKWVATNDENDIAPQSGLYLFKSQGHNHVFFDLYKLKEGEKLWKYYLEYLSKGWSDVKPIGFFIVEGDEKVKNSLINYWFIFDFTNV